MTTQIKLRRDTGTNWDTNSTVILAEGEIGVNLTNGQFKLGDGTSTWAALTYFQPGAGGTGGTGDWAFSGNAAYNATNYNQGLYVAPGGESTSYVFVPGNSESDSTALQLTNGSLTGRVSVTVYNKQWQFDANGSLVYPNVALQRDTGTVNCAGNASTVVYTLSGQYQHTMKLLIQVEGVEGVGSIMDTQACEMILAKSFRANAIAASVYGVVHTSVAPLATFTATWNALTSRVDVICTTPSSNSVNVRLFATEITTSD